MSEKTMVELIEEWQTGAAFLVGSVLFGALVGASIGGAFGALAGFIAFVLGSVVAFATISYVLYGR